MVSRSFCALFFAIWGQFSNGLNKYKAAQFLEKIVKILALIKLKESGPNVWIGKNASWKKPWNEILVV